MPFRKTTAFAVALAAIPLALQGYQLDHDKSDPARFQPQPIVSHAISPASADHPRYELLRPRPQIKRSAANATRTLRLPLATYREPPASILF